MSIGVQVTFDAHDPQKQAEFWATALDYVLDPPPPGIASWTEFATARGIPRNQWRAVVVDRLVAAGATWVREVDEVFR